MSLAPVGLIGVCGEQAIMDTLTHNLESQCQYVVLLLWLLQNTEIWVTYSKDGTQRLLKALLITDFVDEGLSANEDSRASAHVKPVDFSYSSRLIHVVL